MRPTPIPDKWRLKPHARLASIMGECAEAVRPPERLSVAEAAVRYRVLDNRGGGYSGPWRHDLAPWLVEPMNALSDGRRSLIVFMGPAQSGKSEIGNNWFLQIFVSDPADFMLLQVSQSMARDYVLSRIEPMVRLSPELKRKQVAGDRADNRFEKQFLGGLFRAIWPVGWQLRARPVPRWWADDYDDIPPDIGGQGDAITLLGARATTFEGREVGFVSSSPSAGEDAGIEERFREGTRKAWHVPCPSCGEYFPPRFEDLVYNSEAAPEPASKAVTMACHANGCVIEFTARHDMNQRGRWAGPLQVIDRDGVITGPEVETSTDSYALDGTFGFASWSRLVLLARKAELAFEARQDEAPLRAFWNTRIGRNYTSRLAGEAPLEPDQLAERSALHELGQVPAFVKVLVAAVDVQSNRFEVMVLGLGDGLESAIIDRYAILQLEDRATEIDPARYPEHWQVLLRDVIWRRYPMADNPASTMPLLTTAIDTGGLPGVSDNARKFWHRARAAGVGEPQIMLVKGGNDRKAALVGAPTFLEHDGCNRPKKHGARLYLLNVAAIKDVIDARLRRDEPGPGYIHFPALFNRRYFEELTAEERQGDKWKKVRPQNETLDLFVYCLGALVRRAGERADMRWVPPWARPSTPKEKDAEAETKIEHGETIDLSGRGPTDKPRPPVRRRGWVSDRTH